MKQILCFLACTVISTAVMGANNTYGLEFEIVMNGQTIFDSSIDVEAGKKYSFFNGGDQEKYQVEFTLKEKEKNIVLMEFDISEVYDSPMNIISSPMTGFKVKENKNRLKSSPRLKTLSGIEVATTINYEGKQAFSLKAKPTLLVN